MNSDLLKEYKIQSEIKVDNLCKIIKKFCNLDIVYHSTDDKVVKLRDKTKQYLEFLDKE